MKKNLTFPQLLRLPFARAQEVLPQTVDGPAERARASFARAQIVDVFRTLAFINPNLPDTEEYFEMRATDMTRGQWDIHPIRRSSAVSHLQLGATSVMTLMKPVRSGLSFIEAMEAAAVYEQGERKRGCVPTEPSAAELGARYYKRAGEAEGLIFNIHDFPRPTLDGRIVVPDDYPEDAWKAVQPRSVPDPVTLVTKSMKAFMQTMVDRAVEEPGVSSVEDHQERLVEAERIIKNLKVFIADQKSVIKNYADYTRQTDLDKKRYKFFVEHCCESARKSAGFDNNHGLTECMPETPRTKLLSNLCEAQAVYYATAVLQINRFLHINMPVKEHRKVIDTIIGRSEGELKERFKTLSLLEYADTPLPEMPESQTILRIFGEWLAEEQAFYERYKNSAFASVSHSLEAREPG